MWVLAAVAVVAVAFGPSARYHHYHVGAQPADMYVQPGDTIANTTGEASPSNCTDPPTCLPSCKVNRYAPMAPGFQFNSMW
jgi:hypothetical protein